MVTVGIDVGTRATKLIVLKNRVVVTQWSASSSRGKAKLPWETLINVVNEAGFASEDIQYIAATGAGRRQVQFAKRAIPEVSADAQGAIYLFPSVRAVVDIGFEKTRALSYNENGRVRDFVINDRCAAGAGCFIETMYEVLELGMKDMGEMALRSQGGLSLSSQCAVFAESEVVSLVHANTPKEDIARAVYDSVAMRVSSLVLRIGRIEGGIVLLGGLAKDVGLVNSLRRHIGVDILIPNDPGFVGALGAALSAAN